MTLCLISSSRLMGLPPTLRQSLFLPFEYGHPYSVAAVLLCPVQRPAQKKRKMKITELLITLHEREPVPGSDSVPSQVGSGLIQL